MNPLGTIDGDGVRFERMLGAPPALVWEYLTDSEKLSEWFGAGEIDAQIGGRVFLRPGGPVIRGTVTECDAPHRLGYTWNVFMIGSDDPIMPESFLRFELEETGGNTALTLTQTGIVREMLPTSAAGWHTILEILSAHVAGEVPPDFMDVFQSVAEEYERAVANQ